ncbi:MAG: DUF4401 domain-containing protein, partial [Pseudomonadota bacterium]
ARHDRVLLWLGGLFMPVFLVFYYYNLDLSLMAKSAVLAGSGILLLAGSFYVRFRQWDRSI